MHDLLLLGRCAALFVSLFAASAAFLSYFHAIGSLPAQQFDGTVWVPCIEESINIKYIIYTCIYTSIYIERW